MQHYELMVIFNPTLSEDNYKNVIKSYSQFIVDNKGIVVESEPWGLKSLAYPIKKKSVGLYWLLTYKVDPDHVSTFDKEFRTLLWRDESILRYMITKLDKHAVAYNTERIYKKNNPLAKQEPPKKPIVPEIEKLTVVEDEEETLL